MGMGNTTFLVSVQNEAPFAIRGIATASTVFTRMVGTAVLGATLNMNLQQRLPGIDDPMQHLIAHHCQNGQGSGASYGAAGSGIDARGLLGLGADSTLCLCTAGLLPHGLRPRQED